MMAIARESKRHYLTAKRADTFMARLAGLMFRSGLPREGGMLLTPCRSVHTCFMRFSLDLVFLDADFAVVAIVEKLRPWRFVGPTPRARHVLELGAGEAKRLNIHSGDIIDLMFKKA